MFVTVLPVMRATGDNLNVPIRDMDGEISLKKSQKLNTE
jgi:hypothetical protein